MYRKVLIVQNSPINGGMLPQSFNQTQYSIVVTHHQHSTPIERVHVENTDKILVTLSYDAFCFCLITAPVYFYEYICEIYIYKYIADTRTNKHKQTDINSACV